MEKLLDEELDMNLQPEIEEEIDMNLQPETEKKETYKQKLSKKIISAKEKRKQKSEIRKEKRKQRVASIKEKGTQTKEKAKQKFNFLKEKIVLAKEKAAEIKASGKTTKKQVAISYAWSIIQGAITVGGIVLGVTTTFPAIAFAAGIVATISTVATIANVCDAIKTHKEYRKENPKTKTTTEETEKGKKLGLVKKIKNVFSKSKNKSGNTEEQPAVPFVDEELEEETEIEEGLSEKQPKEVNEEEKILKTKLTREQKIGKVKKLGIGHDSRLGIYCLPVPKEDKALQRFIREEYKKEYPEEKIQSFETDNEKVLVLRNKPGMLRK